MLHAQLCYARNGCLLLLNILILLLEYQIYWKQFWERLIDTGGAHFSEDSSKIQGAKLSCGLTYLGNSVHLMQLVTPQEVQRPLVPIWPPDHAHAEDSQRLVL